MCYRMKHQTYPKTSSLDVLTALVPSSHGSNDKKYVVTPRRVACRLSEEKRSGLKQNTLLIEGITYGPHFVSLSKKHNRQVCHHVCQIFIIVIKVVFAQDRPFFYRIKKAGMRDTLAIKEKKNSIFSKSTHINTQSRLNF